MLQRVHLDDESNRAVQAQTHVTEVCFLDYEGSIVIRGSLKTGSRSVLASVVARFGDDALFDVGISHTRPLFLRSVISCMHRRSSEALHLKRVVPGGLVVIISTLAPLG